MRAAGVQLTLPSLESSISDARASSAQIVPPAKARESDHAGATGFLSKLEPCDAKSWSYVHPADSLGGLWGDFAVHGWVNSGKDG